MIGPGRGMLPHWLSGNVTSHEDVGISVAVIVCILYFCDHYSPDHTIVTITRVVFLTDIIYSLCYPGYEWLATLG